MKKLFLATLLITITQVTPVAASLAGESLAGVIIGSCCLGCCAGMGLEHAGHKEAIARQEDIRHRLQNLLTSATENNALNQQQIAEHKQHIAELKGLLAAQNSQAQPQITVDDKNVIAPLNIDRN